MKRGFAGWGKTPWAVRFRAKRAELPELVDVAIIGGGFTGLAAAAIAKRLAPRKTVLLLEAERLGNGASGRTGGMALAETAAGDLPHLGDVLTGYRRILRELNVQANLTLPGVWELARGTTSMEGKPVRAMKKSPIAWSDSGILRVVRKVAGGTVDPGKVVSGLARAAEKRGAQIAEQARVEKIEFREPVRLRVRQLRNGRIERKTISARRVLLATNAGSLNLTGDLLQESVHAEPKLTFALATRPLSQKQIRLLGLSSRHPFYTVDLPYLWGRLMKNGGLIFGSGLVPAWGRSLRGKTGKFWGGLEAVDVTKGEAAERLRNLEERVRRLHPVLQNIRVMHRWGGPILITKGFMPVFRRHHRSERIIIAGGYSGHGVALSVYLGRWAAEWLLGRRELPAWADN